jgi:hypothetical protein
MCQIWAHPLFLQLGRFLATLQVGPLITIYFTLLEISKELPGLYHIEHNIVVKLCALIDTESPPHICCVIFSTVTSTLVWVQ